MYINIIPLDISFSAREGLLYYAKDSYKSQISIGSIAEIPVRQKMCFGVVSSIEEESIYDDLKSISDLSCSFPLVSKYQIDTIFKLSKKYILPVHKALNLFLPKFIFTKLEKGSFQDVSALENFETKDKNNGKIQITHLLNTKTEEVILNMLKGTCVVVFPDDFAVDSFVSNNKESAKEWIVYKNNMSYSKKYKLFFDVLNIKSDILIGTRKILQYNLVRYDNILYIEDSLVKNCFNQVEKYKNLDILISIGETKKFDMNIITSLPGIELLQKAKKYSFDYKTI